MKRFQAFTLIELIVVMGILAILATIVVIAVNPGRQFAASRNTKRANDTRAIAQALTQYAADNNGQNHSGLTATSQSIGTGGLDLTSALVPNYLSAIPMDPQGGTNVNTKYYAYLDIQNRPVVSAVGEINTFIHGGGTGHLQLRGVTGSAATAPDSAPLSITGDIDLRIYTALTDWTPAGNQTLIGKYHTPGNQRSYLWRVTPTGAMNFLLSVDGAGTPSAGSSVLNLTDGTAKWLRVTWRQSDGRLQFFTSDNGQTWTQLGGNNTLAVAGIWDGTAQVTIGAWGDSGQSEPATGKIYRAQILNGIDGTVVYDADFTKIIPGVALTFTESSANTATVTVAP